ncbi:uncharacterized protein LOC142646306 [Dermatophagoides pteronyssinus]|uniref:uncharacterized protein LOC142646306 n=1 Tax=Dermatophagoides pteronyssinus TaxID=6956 RepID=UPI003F66D7D4
MKMKVHLCKYFWSKYRENYMAHLKNRLRNPNVKPINPELSFLDEELPKPKKQREITNYFVYQNSNKKRKQNQSSSSSTEDMNEKQNQSSSSSTEDMNEKQNQSPKQT